MRYILITLFFLSIFNSAYSQLERDSFENDNSKESATFIGINEAQKHTIYPANDVDWIIFKPTDSNHNYKIKLVYFSLPVHIIGQVKNDNVLGLQKTFLDMKPKDFGTLPPTLTPNGNVLYYIKIESAEKGKTGVYAIQIDAEYNSNTQQANKLFSNIPSSGLLAYYPFDGNAKDVSTNNNNGTVIGSVRWVNDRFGNHNSACNIEGKGSYVLLPKLNLGNENQDKTICGWFKLVDGQEWLTIIAQGENSSHRSHLCILPNNLVYYQQYGRDNNPYTLNKFQIEMNDYHFIVAVCSNSFPVNQKVKIYIDGVLKGAISSRNIIGLDSDFSIGRYLEWDTGWKGGNQIIDDVRIYNRILTENEIQSLYHQNGWN